MRSVPTKKYVRYLSGRLPVKGVNIFCGLKDNFQLYEKFTYSNGVG